MKKKILFTIEWYPSVRSANVLCDANIIKALLATGRYEVHCLVYRLMDQKQLEEMDGITVHRFSRSWLWNKIMDSYKDTNSFNFRFWYVVNRMLLRLKQFLTIPIYPIYTPLLVRKFKNEALKLHAQEHFDMVVSEHSGIDTVLAGYWLKKSDPTIKYMPILWDPIVGSEGAKYLPLKWRNKRLLQLERKILAVADCFVSMNPNEENVRQKEQDFLDKIVFLNNPRLVLPEKIETDPDNPHPYYRKGCINILYGGVMGSRTVKQFIDICNLTGIANLNLVFLVSTPTSELEKDLSNIKGTYCLRSYLPHDELLALMMQCEFVLNVGNSNSRMAPSKIFEYMSYGKSIITTYFDEQDASVLYLKNYPNFHAINLNADKKTEAATLNRFLLASHSKIDTQTIRLQYEDCTPEKYVSVIEQLFQVK